MILERYLIFFKIIIIATIKFFLYSDHARSIFFQIRESGDSRIVVDGEPGSGKTTFVKRICYMWAQRFQTDFGGNKSGKLEEYSIVLPIILKFIFNENTLTSILSSQLKCLNICEVCAVIAHQEENPKDIVLLLDGFDEYTGKSFIENLILKKENTDVLCITTSRSHAIEQIKRHSSQAVQQHVRLCGFSEDQVKQYIKQFCQCHGLSAKIGEDLIKNLKNRPNLLEVAKIPIRTEMICVVWAVYRKLGDTLADLYERFSLHLVTHWDQKVPSQCKFEKLSEKEIWKMCKPLWIKVGKLANKWTKQNNLCSMYNDVELIDILGKEDYEKVINIGLLTKSYPSSALQASEWSFPHLTFQEYFIAYLLGNDAEAHDLNAFINRCKEHHYRVLSKCEMIFTFLVNKYPSTAIEIITKLLINKKAVLNENDKVRCEELFDIICGQFQHIVEQGIDIPLPCYLNLKSNYDLKLKVLNLLFEEDHCRKESNLRYLFTDAPIQFKKFLDVLTIKELKVTACNNKELNLVSQKLKHLCSLTCLDISSTVSFFLPGQEDLMNNIQEKKLKNLSITGPGALEVVAKNIHRFTSLEKLQVGEISTTKDKENGKNILSALKGNKSIEQVDFSVMDLNDIIIKEDVQIKVTVRVKKVQPGTLEVASNMLTEESIVALHTLDLSHNSLEHDGQPLGELMVRISTLRVLSLCDCNLKSKTIQAMVDAVVQSPCHIQKLYMGHYENNNRNNAHLAGTALGKLLKHLVDLQVLDLEECNLKSNDFDAMADVLSGSSSKLQTLNLGVNHLGKANKGGFRFLQHMPQLKALKVGSNSTDDPIPAIHGAIETGALMKLEILDISDSTVDSENLARLSVQLHVMRCLKALSLKALEGIKQKDYNNIYKNIPPSLTHLNVNSGQTMSKETTTNPYDILDKKHQISKLLKLNVTLTDSDLGMLQELLEEINENIKVYSNAKENIWKIYVLDK